MTDHPTESVVDEGADLTPVDPRDTTDAHDPTGPRDPSDPTTPADPTVPIDPSNPADPTQPRDPSAPVDPGDPIPSPDPAPPTPPMPPTPPEPTPPVGLDPATAVTNSLDPAIPTNPSDADHPTDPSEPVDPADPSDPVDPTDPSDPVDPVDPVDPAEPAEPAEPVEPVEPADPAEANEAGDVVVGERAVVEGPASDDADGEGGQTEIPVGVEEVVDDETMRRAIEAVLMVSDEPLPALTLARAVGRATKDVADALAALSAEYAEQGRGFDLREVAGGWRYYTREDTAPYVERFVLDGQQARLTQAALETLAVVAYKQPVSRARVSAIRGVNVDGVVRTLVTRGLVEEAGTDTESQATLYRTTSYFLERMGMQGLDDLPELAPYLPEMDDIEDETAPEAAPETEQETEEAQHVHG